MGDWPASAFISADDLLLVSGASTGVKAAAALPMATSAARPLSAEAPLAKPRCTNITSGEYGT